MGEQSQTLTQTSSSSFSNLPPPTPTPGKSRKLSSNSSPINSTTTAITTTIVEPNTAVQPIKFLSCDSEVQTAIRHLRTADPKLVPIIDAHEPPLFSNSDPPFLALAQSILYQQITHKAGTAIYNRFVSLCGGGGEARVCPIAVLALTPPQLLQIGVSSRKVSFLHDLSNKYRSGFLSDSKIVSMKDNSLVSLITMVKGFGALAVHMFMIFTLHRPDVLPINDVNIRKAVQILYGLEQLPRPSQMDALCKQWRPYRSVASWYMWRLVEANEAMAKAEEEAGGGGWPKQLQQQEVLLLEDGTASTGDGNNSCRCDYSEGGERDEEPSCSATLCLPLCTTLPTNLMDDDEFGVNQAVATRGLLQENEMVG